jgi:nitrate/nitrite transport system substrate-binding protein
MNAKTLAGADALTRRSFVGSAASLAGATALIGATQSAFPAGVFAETAGPEVTKVVLGFIALTDSAPLISAKEKGLFDKYGLTEVTVAKQASWGATRDNLVLGSESNGIDGAQILTPMPYLISTGKVTQNNVPVPKYILTRLNYDSQGISVSNEYKDSKAGLDSEPLKEIFAKRKGDGKEIKVAMTFPGGTHDLWLRYWLAAGGIDPDKDVSTIVVPPPPDGGQYEGRQYGRLLRRRAVERTACQPGDRIYRLHDRRNLEAAPRKGTRNARRVGG